MRTGERSIPAAATGRAWYREPWPWLLMSGPAAAVIAGIATVIIAVQTADGVVADDYYKQGLGINKRLDREARARTLALAAELHERAGGIEVTLMRPDGGAWPETLVLRIVHPTRSEQDRVVHLAHRGDGIYHAAVAVTGLDRARLTLEAADWRLEVVPNRRAS